jgi:hypothetical protein
MEIFLQGVIINTVMEISSFPLMLFLGILVSFILTQYGFRQLLKSPGIRYIVLGVTWFVLFSISGFALFVSLLFGISPFISFCILIAIFYIFAIALYARTPEIGFRRFFRSLFSNFADLNRRV